MPIVPTFGREDLPQAQVTGPQADIRAAGLPGQALAHLGQEATDALVGIIHQRNYDYLATNATEFREKHTDALLAAQDQAQKTGNYAGMAKPFIAGLDADIAERLKAAPTPLARDHLAHNLAGVRDHFVQEISRLEGEGTNALQKKQVGDNLSSLAVTAYRNPKLAEDVYGQGLGLIAGAVQAGLSPVNAEAFKENWRHQVYSGVAQNMLENDPRGLAEQLRGGAFDKVLPVDRIVAFQAHADAAVKAADAEARRAAAENALLMRGDVDSAFHDNIASLTDTGKFAVPLTKDQIAAAYPKNPARVNAMWNAITDAQHGYTARLHVALSSPQEDQETLTKMTPSGPGYADQAAAYNAVVRSIETKNKALAADPSGYVRQVAPSVATAFQAAQADPRKLPAAIALQDAAYDRLGLPKEARPVLPAAQAAGIVAQLKGADPTKLNAGAALDDLSTRYGAAWPRVLGDLVRAGLPDHMHVLAAMDAPTQAAARQDLQRAATPGAPKLDLGEGVSSAINKALPDALADFRRTVMAPGAVDNRPLLNTVQNSIGSLARYYVATGAEADPEKAVQAATKAVLNDKYTFAETMRLPKWVDGKPGPSVGEATVATQRALDALKPGELLDARNLPGGVAADRLADVKRATRWFPNADDSGLIALAQNRDGRYQVLRRADGTPLQVRWQDMHAAGAPPAEAEPFDPAVAAAH